MMIEIEELRKEYNGVLALNIPSLSIDKGETFGLIGNNGAGKTTLFRLILDLIKASDGKVLSKAKSVALSEHWKSYTGSYLDEGFLIDFLTPKEYFEFCASLYGLSKGDVEEFMIENEAFFGKDILENKKYIRKLSKGNKSKVGVMAAIMSKPEILVLDEPFANLDPSSQSRLKKILTSLNETSGTTLLISSHDLSHVTEVCDRIVLLEEGEMIKDIKTTKETLKELEDYFRV